MHRSDLQDWQWVLIEDLFPSKDRKQGEPRRDHRTVLNGMFHVLHTAGAWRDLPERYARGRPRTTASPAAAAKARST
jgi:transposase